MPVPVWMHALSLLCFVSIWSRFFLPALPHDSMGMIIYILSGTQGQQIAAYLIIHHVLVLALGMCVLCMSEHHHTAGWACVSTWQPGHTCSCACHGLGLLIDGLRMSVWITTVLQCCQRVLFTFLHCVSGITWHCWHDCLYACRVPVSPLGGLDMLVCVSASPVGSLGRIVCMISMSLCPHSLSWTCLLTCMCAMP